MLNLQSLFHYLTLCVYYFSLLLDIFTENWQSQYLKKGEVSPGVQAGQYDGEVRSDITTSFFILLAIFFPSVTGRLAVNIRKNNVIMY